MSEKEETVSQPNNNSAWVTKAVCQEKVKRIDRERDAMKHDISVNSQNITRIHTILISTLASSVLSLLGVIVILFRVAS